jgi:hypothetical protein
MYEIASNPLGMRAVKTTSRAIRKFALDISNNSAAEPASSQLLQKDSPATALLAIVSIASSLKSVRELSIDLLGLPGVVVPILLSIITLAVCVFVISSKNNRSLAASQPRYEFAYGKWVRLAAKVGLLAVLLLILPFNLFTAAEHILPLPTTIYGVS